MSAFKQDFTFERRNKESSSILGKYPERVPVIIERSENSKHLTLIDKNKFLVPKELKMSQLLWVIRKRMNIRREQAVFLSSESGTLFSGTEYVLTVYENNTETYKQKRNIIISGNLNTLITGSHDLTIWDNVTETYKKNRSLSMVV